MEQKSDCTSEPQTCRFRDIQPDWTAHPKTPHLYFSYWGVTSGFTYWISMRLMRQIPASAATSSAFLIPLFGVTWGALFLGEPLTAGLLPGVVLILLASALLTGFNPFRAFLRGAREVRDKTD